LADHDTAVSTRLTISVVVPTYRRVDSLIRCIAAVEGQTRPPQALIVVCRETDAESRAAVDRYRSSIPLVVAIVTEPGQVAALNAGLAHAATDVIAITDDDAAPRPDWLERVERHFLADSEVGGVGGRDFVAGLEDMPGASNVGRIQWVGRTVGNHHLGIGPARCVEFLKGANMTYRRDAIGPVRFDTRLLGSGAQVHNDLAFSLAIRRRGWKLIYDPNVAVDHYPATRFDGDSRDVRSIAAIADAAYNETLTLLEHLPSFRRLPFVVWAIAIGTRDAPGLLQGVRLAPFRLRMWRTVGAVAGARIRSSARVLGNRG
jgi:GT2 family glycosyltransferase